MRYCEVCGKGKAELHHIIFKSEASYMANIAINFKYLCDNCHRGKNGPHMNNDINLRYKRELQDNLFNIFKEKDYFNEEDIKEKLSISTSEVIRLCRKLKRYKEGYKVEDIVKLCMGNKLYMESWEKEIYDLIGFV
ncbi:hypothetical protein KQI89_14055 [Clostridium sp. MSJ-4]|uniref:HNH endonuclease n=1 Tax=Clostridium simiarum TaxID=2841506 RepID=A0ABS6F327_9CLOT|nr:hypothetical protein [Clostridium simiarum]MBU5592873.1 hypothetical protein [Clostridium simiarum]